MLSPDPSYNSPMMNITKLTLSDNLRHAGRIMLSYNLTLPQIEGAENFNSHYAAIGEGYQSFICDGLAGISAEYDEMQSAGLRTRFIPLKIAGEYTIRKGQGGRMSVSLCFTHVRGRKIADFSYVTHTWSENGLLLPPKMLGKSPRGKWDGCWVEGERARYYRNIFDKKGEYSLKGDNVTRFIEVLDK